MTCGIILPRLVNNEYGLCSLAVANGCSVQSWLSLIVDCSLHKDGPRLSNRLVGLYSPEGHFYKKKKKRVICHAVSLNLSLGWVHGCFGKKDV